MLSTEIERLVHLVSKLPGLGPRSARRAVLHMLKHRLTYMMPLSEAIDSAAKNVQECSVCGNMDAVDPCHICTDEARDASVICVVESVADLWAIERGKIFVGHYHILGGSLSVMHGNDPSKLNIHKLFSRVKDGKVHEVILATNATPEGQTTAYYITELLKDLDVQISRLANGIPIGGELDYLDDGTLLAALQSRQNF